MIQRLPIVMFFSVFLSMASTLLLSRSAWSSNLVLDTTRGVDNPVPIAVGPF